MGFFYTGKGDSGKSAVGKKKIAKTRPVMEALGDLDELNSLIGLVRSRTGSDKTRKILREAQESLFIIQASIAIAEFGGSPRSNKSGRGSSAGGKYPAPELEKSKVKELEKTIDAIEKKIKPERGFIISGESESSAWLDYARAVTRRAERSVLKYHKTKKLNANILAYINRLSSLFFALARSEAKKSGKKEQHPKYK